MAPGLALDSLSTLPAGSTVLDPMSGSGTVLRQASDLGYAARGFDVDPLAVLMSKVWTTPVSDAQIEAAYTDMLARASHAPAWSRLRWLENDQETQDFIAFWFNDPQRSDLMRLSAALADMTREPSTMYDDAAVDVLRLNLSRIIVTKEQAASLARDTSHSRPHRVSTTSKFDVFVGYHRSLNAIRKRLLDAPPTGSTNVSIGDARSLKEVSNDSIDAVITSPPYLNAIDYMRGHRLALVWLGWKHSDLRAIRSSSIGAERAIPSDLVVSSNAEIVKAMIGAGDVCTKNRNMIQRYANDLWFMMDEIVRVLKNSGKATLVVGNSCLKGAFIKNADGVSCAANLLTERSERDLPQGSRYLPTTGPMLGKRMRTETVLSFAFA
jgi:hypothetical protein